MQWYVVLGRIALAMAIGLAIGVEREYKNRPAGMRTHILVCMGACTIALVESCFVADLSRFAGENVTYNFGRLSAQVVCGVGFLGAGTIFMSQKKVAGLTTAASLWNVACLGVVVGYGYYFIAVTVSVLVLTVLAVMQKIVHVNAAKKVQIEFIHRVDTITYINRYFEQHGIETLDLDFHVKNQGERNVYTNIYTLRLPSGMTYANMVNDLSEHQNVLGISTMNV